MRRDDPGPYSLDVLKAVAAPQLFATDAKALVARYVAWFEEASGRTLYPMQVEMLLIETLAYAMSMLGEEGQMAVEEGLVSRASITGLTALGPNRSTERLTAAPARVTLSFSIETVLAANVVVPAGTRVLASGETVFATDAPAVIAAGQTTAIVTATCSVPGAIGNGFLPGQLTVLLDPVAGVAVENLTESADGADEEAEDLYRLRLANAFERISTGGSRPWYRETSMGVSSAIIDVAIVRPQPCYIDIYPLTLTGAAGPELRDQVAAAFDTDAAIHTRFGDLVTVKAATAVIEAAILTVRVRGATATIAADAEAAALVVLTGWRERLGATIAPSEVEAAVRPLTGVVDAELAGLAFQQLAPNEYLVATLTVSVEVLA